MVSPVPRSSHDTASADEPSQDDLFSFGYTGIRDHIDDLWKVLLHHRTRGINHVSAVSASVLVYLGSIAASDHSLGWLGGTGVSLLMICAVLSLLVSWKNVRYWLAGVPDPYFSPGDPPGEAIRSDYLEYRPEISKAICDQRGSMIETIAAIEKRQKILQLPCAAFVGVGIVLCVLDLTPIC